MLRRYLLGLLLVCACFMQTAQAAFPGLRVVASSCEFDQWSESAYAFEEASSEDTGGCDKKNAKVKLLFDVSEPQLPPQENPCVPTAYQSILSEKIWADLPVSPVGGKECKRWDFDEAKGVYTWPKNADNHTFNLLYFLLASYETEHKRSKEAVAEHINKLINDKDSAGKTTVKEITLKLQKPEGFYDGDTVADRASLSEFNNYFLGDDIGIYAYLEEESENKACVYVAIENTEAIWHVTGAYPRFASEIKEHEASTLRVNSGRCITFGHEGIRESAKIKDVGRFIIDPVCRYPSSPENNQSQYKYHGRYIGAASALVQCVENTMRNILGADFNVAMSSKEGGQIEQKTIRFAAQNTVIGKIQKNLKTFIQAVLALYIVIIGFRMLIGRAIFKQNEMLLVVFKLAIVVYFAAGTGLNDWAQSTFDFSRNLSRVMMTATFHPVTDSNLENQQEQTQNAENDLSNTEKTLIQNVGLDESYAAAINKLEELVTMLSPAALDFSDPDYGEIEVMGVIVRLDDRYFAEKADVLREYQASELLKTSFDEGELWSSDHKYLSATLQELLTVAAATGDRRVRLMAPAIEALFNDVTAVYKNRDLQQKYLRALDAQAREKAVNKRVTQTDGFRYRNCMFSDASYAPGKKHLLIWDTLDCKVNQYLGVGYDPSNKYSPALFRLVGMTFLAVNDKGWNLIICIFTLIFLIFVLFFFIRAVHIYLISVIGLVMLVFIGPLAIPMVLFDKTKYILFAWLKMIMSFILQPVVLILLLTVALFSVDNVFYGGNKSFDQTTHVINDCTDKEALACIYKNATIIKADNLISDMFLADDLRTIEVYYTKEHLEEDEWDQINEEPQLEGRVVVLALLKMWALMFLIYSITNVVLEVSNRLVDGLGGATGQGIAGLTNFKNVGVSSAARAVGSVANRGSSALQKGLNPARTARAVRQGVKGKK